ncbi:MAG: (Fe-S)-binding protein [Gordonibacter sp.]
MEEYEFEDVLAGSTVSCTFPRLVAQVAGDGRPRRTRTLFFPGCSLINYGLPLVQSVYGLLSEAGAVEGISLLCCGKILSFEPDGKEVRAAFEQQLRERVANAGVERIVAACPNCVLALRAALDCDERTAGVEVAALPAELAALGYRIDEDVAARMLANELVREETDVPPLFSVHDSCPDRATGEFADGLRALLPSDLFVEPEHCRRHSGCCGSLVRAAGKFELADEQSRQRGAEAVSAGAEGIVAACVSCAYQLSASQRRVPVFHYLELLYDWRIDWRNADQYMKLRFLFDDSLGTEEASGDTRPFMGLTPDAGKGA